MRSLKELKKDLYVKEAELSYIMEDDSDNNLEDIFKADELEADIAKLNTLIAKSTSKEDKAQEIVNKQLNKEEIEALAKEMVSTGVIDENSPFKYFYDYETKQYIELVEENGYYMSITKGEIIKNIKNTFILSHKTATIIADEIPRVLFTFNPLKEQNFFDEYKYKNVINMYRDTPLLMTKKTKSIKTLDLDETPNIKKLLKNLFLEDEEMLQHWLNYFAYIVQTKEKVMTSFVFMGIPGAGKGILFNQIQKKIFQNYAIEISADDLYSNFNSHWVENKLFISANEISHDDKTSRNSHYNRLKAIISDETIIVERKGVQQFERPNTFNVQISSNGNTPIKLENSDRRYNIVRTGTDIKKIHNIEELIIGISNELNTFVQNLMNLETNRLQANRVIDNNAKDIIVQNSETAIENICSALKKKDIIRLKELTADYDTTTFEYIESFFNTLENNLKNGFFSNKEGLFLFEMATGEEELSSVKIGKLYSKTLGVKSVSKKINGKNEKVKFI